MAREFVGESSNGKKVYVETETSHAATHMKDTPGLLELVKEALPTIVLPDGEKRVELEVDMGRPLGKLELVEIRPGEEVIYAKRPNRDKYAPFVKREPKELETTSSLVLSLDKVNEDEYDLYTTFIGPLTPSLPHGDGKDRPGIIDFWNTHALVLGTQEVLSETKTNKCPWCS